jgi:hypothetical protein
MLVKVARGHGPLLQVTGKKLFGQVSIVFFG